MIRPRPPTVRVRLDYDFLEIFSGWYISQRDPLYAVISRRGNKVDQVELEISKEELETLIATAEHIIEHGAELLDKKTVAPDVRVAKRYLPEWQALLEQLEVKEEVQSAQAELARRRGLNGLFDIFRRGR